MAGIMLVVMGLTGLARLSNSFPDLSLSASQTASRFSSRRRRSRISSDCRWSRAERVCSANEGPPDHLDTTQWPTGSLRRFARVYPPLAASDTADSWVDRGAFWGNSNRRRALGCLWRHREPFGGNPSGLPSFSIPHFSPALVELLLPSAITVAFLAAVESLLSAVVADGMIHDRHDSNTELVAQGIANIASPLFGGFPATGAIARTATNVRSGANRPWQE